MKKYLITIILNVDDKTNERKPDVAMIERRLNALLKTGIVESREFRGDVVFNVVGFQSEVNEIVI